MYIYVCIYIHIYIYICIYSSKRETGVFSSIWVMQQTSAYMLYTKTHTVEPNGTKRPARTPVETSKKACRLQRRRAQFRKRDRFNHYTARILSSAHFIYRDVTLSYS